MLKIKILKIGKLKKEYLEAEKEFLKRLKSFASIEIIDKKDDTAIEKSLNPDTHIIALDRVGKQYSSEDFAEIIRTERDFGKGAITILIGGPHGFPENLLKKAHAKISFGKLTYTHQLAYILLLEQLYRTHTILTNKKYHY
ncbi:MAG: 23S rRNA (pseudouridine(1915)-N(3))-methyltransferase RlmH [Patescibacteria group bacterium]|nr:23S rRNA (pseudouridine(1915)-N(3))-methyltransferase RlmH [Patescibacteria group bacterium]